MAGFAARHSVTSIDHHDLPPSPPSRWSNFWSKLGNRKHRSVDLVSEARRYPVEIGKEDISDQPTSTASRFSVSAVDETRRISTDSTSSSSAAPRRDSDVSNSGRRDSTSSGRRACRDSFSALALT